MNFVWETDDDKKGSIILLIFNLWECFNCWWMRVETESLISGELKLHLSVPGVFTNWLG